MTTVLHLAALAFALAIIAVVLGVAFLAVCAAIQSGAHDDPRIPADVDLQQAVETTKAITDAGPQQYRAGRARGYARSRV